MMIFILMMLAIYTSTFLMCSSLSTGVMLMLSMLISMLFLTYLTPPWLIMMMFIIFISGMMVLLSYFMSLEPNITMNSMSTPMTFLIILLLIWPTNKYLTPPPTKSFLTPSPMPILLNSTIEIMSILLLMLLYLLIIIVSMVHKEKGPLRPFYLNQNL